MSHTQALQVQRVSLIVSKKCTLKCKLCGALSPYIKSYHPEFTFLKNEIDAFFRIVDTTGIIDISGGEPLMRGTDSDFVLGETVQYLAHTYPEKFSRLRLFTNGTIIPSDRLCDVFKEVSVKKPFSITIDDYGKHSPHVSGIADKLAAYNIDFVIRDYIHDIHCGGWVDLRDISLKNSEEEAKKIFSKCAIPQKLGCCLELLDGILSPCSVAATRYLCGMAEKNDDDIIDLYADTAEMQEKLNKILSSSCFVSCFYCDGGMSEDSKRCIPAEQADVSDIEKWHQQYSMRF